MPLRQVVNLPFMYSMAVTQSASLQDGTAAISGCKHYGVSQTHLLSKLLVQRKGCCSIAMAVGIVLDWRFDTQVPLVCAGHE
jgi:hypothetical protein